MRGVPKHLAAISVSALICLGGSPALAEIPHTTIAMIEDSFVKDVAHVLVAGEPFVVGGPIESTGSGTGFHISRRYVLTVNHILPPPDRFKSIIVTVRFGRENRDYSAKIAGRDEKNDLALLDLGADTEAPTPANCPVATASDRSFFDDNWTIVSFGYSFGFDKPLITLGYMGEPPDPLAELWTTRSDFNVGDSGAPVFSGSGNLAGLVESGAEHFTLGGKEFNVHGLSFILPGPRILTSPIMAPVLRGESVDRCLRAGFHSSIQGYSLGFESLRPLRLRPPHESTIDYAVRLNGAEGTEKSLYAESGYKITQCQWQPSPAIEAAGASCAIPASGINAVARWSVVATPAGERPASARLRVTFTPK